MAGNPIKRQLLADIEKAGGFEFILSTIVDGGSIQDLAKRFGVSRKFLSELLNKDPQQKIALKQARKMKAETFADQALQIVDTVEESPNAISKAREQANIRKWLAGVHDPETYGQKQNSVTINVGDLHLDALRQAPILDRNAEDAEYVNEK